MSPRRRMFARPSRMICAVLLLALAGGVAGTGVGVAATYGKAIEGYPRYEPQRTCSPTAKVGTRKLADYLQRAYPGTGSSGIVRSCNVGGMSEHKEGRAFDWRVNYFNAKQRGQADSWLRQVFATDKYGNKHALARRMGLMYVIWNKRIYSLDRPGWRAYNGASAHRDHVHISLSWAGARGQTSFYAGKVLATPKPAPKPPKATPKPTPKPAPTPKPPPLPAVLDQKKRPEVTHSLLATGQTERTKYSLRSGTTYRLVAVGTFKYGKDSTEVADALCAWNPWTDAGWTDASKDPAGKRLGLTVNGAAAWKPRAGVGCNTTDHAYVMDYRAPRTGPVTFRLADPAAADNTGRISLKVLRAGANPAQIRGTVSPSTVSAPTPVDDARTDGFTLLDETVEVPASATAAVTTTGVLTAGVTYELDASGTFSDGHGQADAQCSRRQKASGWRRTTSVDPFRPTQDHLNLYLDGAPLPGSWPAGDSGCYGSHRYRTSFVPAMTSRVSFRIWDPYPTDNSGALQVRLRRSSWPTAPRLGALLPTGAGVVDEQLFVQASDPEGALTTGLLRKDVTYAIRVSGRWSYGAGLADAECATAPGDTGPSASWRRRAGDYRGLGGRDLFDLYLDGIDLNLRSTDGRSNVCTGDSVYVAHFKPKRTSRVPFALWGLEPRDASGGVTVQIKRL